MSTMYDYAVINVMNFSAGEKRAELLRAFSSVRCSRIGKLAILGDRELLLLIVSLPKTQRTAGEMEEMIAEFMKSVGEIIQSAEIKCGICREGNTLRDIRKCVEKCRRVIEINNNYLEYVFEPINMILLLTAKHSIGSFQSQNANVNYKGLIGNPMEGNIAPSQEQFLDQTERILNGFFTQAYSDIKQVFYKKSKLIG